MHCPKCNVDNSDGSTVCVSCGNSLVAAVNPGGPPMPAADGVLFPGAQNSKLAKASFIMGLLCILIVTLPFLALPAMICGIIALIKISNHRDTLKGTGLAITGIAIPCILSLVVPFFALVLGMMLPATARVHGIANRVVCGTNLKGLSTAMVIYTNDYDDQLPTVDWCDLLIEEVDVSPRSLICPESDDIEGECSYAMNQHVAGKKLSALPPDIVLFFETDMGSDGYNPRNTAITTRRHYTFLNQSGGNTYNKNTLVYKDRFNQLGGPQDMLIVHADQDPGCNVAFADGRTEFVPESDLPNLKWTVDDTDEELNEPMMIDD